MKTYSSFCIAAHSNKLSMDSYPMDKLSTLLFIFRTMHFYPTNNYPLDRRFIRWIGQASKTVYILPFHAFLHFCISLLAQMVNLDHHVTLAAAFHQFNSAASSACLTSRFFLDKFCFFLTLFYLFLFMPLPSCFSRGVAFNELCLLAKQNT